VFIHVEPHDFFRREDTDVICQIPVTFVQAALGDTLPVPTLNGEKELKIPKGTQYGDVFRFRGEGIPSLRTGHRGDQIIQVTVKTPTSLSRKQEDLLREFARQEERKLSKKLKDLLKGGASKAAL
jgi:molecular chaperone DnaJ